MRVKDVYPEIEELIGTCSSAVIFTAITRGMQLLAAKSLFDPQIGYLDFSLTEGNTFALPRDVRSPIRININGNPSYARGKLFEFAMNTDGTVDGDIVGWEWADRGIIPINDERPLPGKLSYLCDSLDDVGKTLTAFGRDMDGREVTATLSAAVNGALKTPTEWVEVSAVRREMTSRDCYLISDSTPIARYYPDEEVPKYRIIKLARSNCTVRMIYRKETPFRITDQEDLLPVNSALGIIQAVRAYRYYQLEQYELGALAEAQAVKFVTEDQASRNDHLTVGPSLEIQSAINSVIRTTDGLIVADIYDDASEIYGPVGRQKLLDRITDAVECLSRKTSWDSASGVVDIWRPENNYVVPGGRGTGYFVLPRFVEAIQAISPGGYPSMPHSQWFQFHINGPGERNFSTCCGWDELGETVLINRLPLDAQGKYPLGVKLASIPLLSDDIDCEIRVFGTERLADGSLVPIRRNGALGYLVACKPVVTLASDSPTVVDVERITKEASTGFVKLVVAASLTSPADILVTDTGEPLVTDTGDLLIWGDGLTTTLNEGTLLGYYYPDELEPRYRAIQVGTHNETRIRVRFKRRTVRYSSIYEPIPLRSRLAIVAMLRSLKLQASDVKASLEQQAIAMQYLTDEAVSSAPTEVFDMQISGALPTVRRNIS